MRFALAILLCAASGAAGQTADAERLVRDVLERFREQCAVALVDPQGYVNTVPNPSAHGTKSLTVSPDGKLVHVEFIRDGLNETMSFTRFPNGLSAQCNVYGTPTHGDYSQNYTASMDTYNNFSEAMATAFEALGTADPDLTLIGGRIPTDIVYPYDNELSRTQSNHRFGYGFLIDIAGEQLPVSVWIHDIHFNLSTWRMIEVPK